MIQRYGCPGDNYTEWDDDGDYVFYTEHLEEVEKQKNKVLEVAQKVLPSGMYELLYDEVIKSERDGGGVK